MHGICVFIPKLDIYTTSLRCNDHPGRGAIKKRKNWETGRRVCKALSAEVGTATALMVSQQAAVAAAGPGQDPASEQPFLDEAEAHGLFLINYCQLVDSKQQTITAFVYQIDSKGHYQISS